MNNRACQADETPSHEEPNNETDIYAAEMETQNEIDVLGIKNTCYLTPEPASTDKATSSVRKL